MTADRAEIHAVMACGLIHRQICPNQRSLPNRVVHRLRACVPRETDARRHSRRLLERQKILSGNQFFGFLGRVL